MVVAIPVSVDGTTSDGWGRAPRVAVARVTGGRIESWDEHDVRWDVLHDEGPEGGHHARIARFLLDHGVEVVVAGHVGPPMVQMLRRMGIGVVVGVTGEARAAVLKATRLPA